MSLGPRSSLLHPLNEDCGWQGTGCVGGGPSGVSGQRVWEGSGCPARMGGRWWGGGQAQGAESGLMGIGMGPQTWAPQFLSGVRSWTGRDTGMEGSWSSSKVPPKAPVGGREPRFPICAHGLGWPGTVSSSTSRAVRAHPALAPGGQLRAASGSGVAGTPKLCVAGARGASCLR